MDDTHLFEVDTRGRKRKAVARKKKWRRKTSGGPITKEQLLKLQQTCDTMYKNSSNPKKAMYAHVIEEYSRVTSVLKVRYNFKT